MALVDGRVEAQIIDFGLAETFGEKDKLAPLHKQDDLDCLDVLRGLL